jgi:hypothetical protein
VIWPSLKELGFNEVTRANDTWAVELAVPRNSIVAKIQELEAHLKEYLQ